MAHATEGSKSLSIDRDGDSGWLNPKANGPIAVFDASVLDEDLNAQTSGAVTWKAGATRTRLQVPTTSDFGWLWRFNAATFPDDNGNNNEKRYFCDPIEHVWEVLEIWQPSNYFDRYIVAAFSTEALGVVDNWLEGDTVTTVGGTATYVSSRDQAGEAKHFFKDLSSGDTVVFPDGATVTNDRNAETFTIDRALFIATNKKLFELWVNDGVNGGLDGYSQSGLFIESNSGFDDAGSPDWKINRLASAESGEGTSGTLANEVSPTNAKVWDTTDNGSWITFVIERKRSSNASDPTGLVRIYKQVDRVGADNENLTLIYQATDIQVFHSAENNGFTAGYIFGAANGGYEQETDFYVRKYEMYETKPQILTGAGL